MSINIVFIISILICVSYSIEGFKKGLVRGMTKIISYILGIMVLGIMLKGIGNIVQKSWVNVLMALILLALVRIIHRILKLILDSCKLVSKLPVIKWFDKTAGIVLGFAQATCLIWLLFIIFGYFDFMNINQWILHQVEQSTFLKIIYHNNLIIRILQNF